MARSGAEYLRTLLPSTLDKPGLAKLRILDRFTLTSGNGACNYTGISDGRHFYDLDYLILRVLAEGTMHAIGSAGTALPNEENLIMPKSSNVKAFLVPPSRASSLAESRDIGYDLDNLFRRAFNERHVSFIGDSTTAGTHHQLAAWLLATNSNSSFDKSAKKRLTGRGFKDSALTSEAAATALKEGCHEERKAGITRDTLRCGYIEVTFCKHNQGCSQELDLGWVGLSFTAGNGAISTRHHAAHAVNVFERHNQHFENKFKESIVVLHGGLHYLHLFPARGFEGLLGLNLGKYLERVQQTVDAIRKVVGPSGLVVWSTIGNVCADKYTGRYGDFLSYIKDGIRKCRQKN
jgi:hypothetical protein